VLVISIAALFGSPSNVNMDGHRVLIESKSITSSINALLISKNNYQFETKKQLSYVNWKSDFRKTGNPVPRMSGYLFSYDFTLGEGNYFCITASDTVSAHRSRVLTKAKVVLGDDHVYLNENCGALTNHPSTDDTSIYDTLSLTVFTGD
jgi:hypothetical protein